MWSFNKGKYSSIILYFYDTWLMKFGNPYIWRCSTDNILMPLYQLNIGLHHCDLGCGTGYYLVHSSYQQKSTITLLDLEHPPLRLAKKRLQKSHKNLHIQAQQHDILSPEPIPLLSSTLSSESHGTEKYDSISLTYLLHTLPIQPSEKAQIFSKLKMAIKPSSGVIFGATILGNGPWHSFAARILLWILNWEGRLANYADGVDVFVDGLEEHFAVVRAAIVGSVLIFEARCPKI